MTKNVLQLNPQNYIPATHVKYCSEPAKKIVNVMNFLLDRSEELHYITVEYQLHANENKKRKTEN